MKKYQVSFFCDTPECCSIVTGEPSHIFSRANVLAKDFARASGWTVLWLPASHYCPTCTPARATADEAARVEKEQTIKVKLQYAGRDKPYEPLAERPCPHCNGTKVVTWVHDDGGTLTGPCTVCQRVTLAEREG